MRSSSARSVGVKGSFRLTLEDGNVIFVRLEKKARLASECIHVSADRNARHVYVRSGAG
jgi:hypothetical protein